MSEEVVTAYEKGEVVLVKEPGDIRELRCRVEKSEGGLYRVREIKDNAEAERACAPFWVAAKFCRKEQQ